MFSYVPCVVQLCSIMFNCVQSTKNARCFAKEPNWLAVTTAISSQIRVGTGRGGTGRGESELGAAVLVHALSIPPPPSISSPQQVPPPQPAMDHGCHAQTPIFPKFLCASSARRCGETTTSVLHIPGIFRILHQGKRNVEGKRCVERWRLKLKHCLHRAQRAGSRALFQCSACLRSSPFIPCAQRSCSEVFRCTIQLWRSVCECGRMCSELFTSNHNACSCVFTYVHSCSCVFICGLTLSYKIERDGERRYWTRRHGHEYRLQQAQGTASSAGAASCGGAARWVPPDPSC